MNQMRCGALLAIKIINNEFGLLYVEQQDKLQYFMQEVEDETMQNCYGKKQPSYSKIKKDTNYIERFNNTVRQRVSRPVRKALSFSKIITNHIGAKIS